MTVRPTVHDEKISRRTGGASRFVSFNGYDFSRTSANHFPGAGGGVHV